MSVVHRTITEKIQKLPAWAQRTIGDLQDSVRYLTSEVERLQANLAGKNPESSITTRVAIDTEWYLDEYSSVTFWADKSKYHGITVSWARHDDRTRVRVTTARVGQLVVEPVASNCVNISNDDILPNT